MLRVFAAPAVVRSPDLWLYAAARSPAIRGGNHTAESNVLLTLRASARRAIEPSLRHDSTQPPR